MAPRPADKTNPPDNPRIVGIPKLKDVVDATTNQTISASVQERKAAAQSSALTQLQGMSIPERMELLTLLWRKGFGGQTKPQGGGLSDTNIATFADFLIFQQADKTTYTKGQIGLPTAQMTLDNLDTLVKDVGFGAKQQITYTSKMDVTSIFNQVAERDLGRKPTEKELNRFFDAYHSLESKATTKDQAPSVGAAAESQLKQTNKGEVKATTFSGYAQAFQDMLRGA